MIATLGDNFSRLIRRFAGISLLVAIAACGGGDSPGSGTTVAQASQRKSALAAELGIPYYVLTDLSPLVQPYSSTCNILYDPKFINNTGTLVGSGNVAQCSGSFFGSNHGYALQPVSDVVPTQFSFGPMGLNDIGNVVGHQYGPYPTFSLSVYIGYPDNSNANTWTVYSIAGVMLQAAAINNNNEAVGSYSAPTSGEQGATLYSNGVVTFLAPPPGSSSSEARGINDFGTIVGAVNFANCSVNCVTAVRYFNGVWEMLGAAVGEVGGGSRAIGINNQGQIIGVTYSFGGTTDSVGWVLDGNTKIEIPLPTPLTLGASYAVDPRVINKYGIVVGDSSQTPPGTQVPFIYSNGQSYNLNALIDPNSGWNILTIFDINDNGQIVAQARGPDNALHSVRLDPTTANPFPRTGAAPILSLSPTGLDFGSVTVGSSKDLSLTVTNSGTGTLTGIAVGGGAFSVIAGATVNLAAGQSQEVTVRFAPVAAGAAALQLLISTNVGNRSVPLNGSGSVVPPPTACVSQIAPWAVGTSSCSATYPGGPHGSSTTLSDIIAPDTGTVTASCANGQVTLTAPTCVAAPPPPTISSLSPTSGSVGTSVLIQGGGFGSDPGTVTICGLATQQILNWEDTIVNFIVPRISAGTPCNVRLTTAAFRQADPVVYTVLGKASISGLIADTGGNPLKNAKLALDGVVKATLTPNSNGQYVTASLPAGTYTMTPVLPGYSFTPSSRNIVLSGTPLTSMNYAGAPVLPLIVGIGPKQGAQGDVVTISGTGFGLQDAATSKVKFGAVEAFVRIGDWTDKSIIATVPFIDAAVSVTVKTAGGGSNPVPFTYKAPRNLNIYPAASSTSTVGLLALSFIQHAATSVAPDSVTQEIEIENLAQTWYWVKPASGGVYGSGLPTKPFLIGPGMKRSFGPLTFIKKAYLTFHADNSICVLVPGGGWPSPSQLPSCIADEQSRAILWAMEMEIVWRTVFGAPLPMDLAGLIYDPLTFALAETVLKSDKAFALASDISAAVTEFDPYALAHIPGDVLEMVTMKEINDLLRQLGISPVTRGVIQWLNMTINAGVATKFAVETLIYPNTGDLTFVAK